MRPLTRLCFLLFPLSSCLPSLYSLESAFVHGGVHPLFFMLRFDPPLTRQGAAIAHLDSLPSYDLVLWTDGFVPFPFGKGGFGVLSICSVALRPLFPFRQTQFVQVFPLKPAPFNTLFASLSSTSKSAISVLFFYLTLVLSSPPCPLLPLFFYLKLCGRSGRNCLLSPFLSGYNGSPDTRSPGKRRG